MGKCGNTIRLILNAAYNNGISFFNEKIILADSVLSPPREGSNTRVVTLRFAAPAAEAEQLVHAFRSGEAELTIEGVKPLEV